MVVVTCEESGREDESKFRTCGKVRISRQRKVSFSTTDECERIDVTPEKGSERGKVTSVAEEEREIQQENDERSTKGNNESITTEQRRQRLSTFGSSFHPFAFQRRDVWASLYESCDQTRKP